jgi:hypothetical protein
MTTIEHFDDIEKGLTGSMRVRRYGRGTPWSQPVPCTVFDLDRRDDGRVWSIHVRDESTGRNHKVFCTPTAKRPGVWVNMQTAAKRNGIVRVVLCDVDDDVMRASPRASKAFPVVDFGDDA